MEWVGRQALLSVKLYSRRARQIVVDGFRRREYKTITTHTVRITGRLISDSVVIPVTISVPIFPPPSAQIRLAPIAPPTTFDRAMLFHLPEPLLMMLLHFLLPLGELVSVLLHLLPFTVRALNPQRRDSDRGGILQACLVLELLGFLGRHFSTGNLGVSLVSRFHGGIDIVRGVDGGHGGQTGREVFFALHLLCATFVFR